ncbi:MAG: hypothetical protein FJ012_04700 [Chloroflexi bacterium]|nr:hypothetical protein [Chloroflexota bacterium]
MAKEYNDAGDALRGERIAVEARDIDKIRYKEGGSGKHGIQFTKLRDSAYCVIEIPLKAVRERKSK